MHSNKVAIVTGASSGIGEAIVNKLISQEFSIVICARSLDKLENIAEKYNKDGLNVLPLKCDLTNESDIKEVVRLTGKKFGRLDLLVNSAGTGKPASLIDGDTNQWREMLDVNVLAMCIFNREALALIHSSSDRGMIVNISSLAGHRIYREGGMYPASKFAVRALTESLRRELRQKGSSVRICSVSPGLVKTNFAYNYFPDSKMADDVYSSIEPLTGEDIADAVMYAYNCPKNVDVNDMLIRPLNQDA